MTVTSLDLLLRALVLLAVSGTAAFVLRRQSASLRATVWTIAFGGLLLLPALSTVTPEWPLPVLRASASSPSTASAADDRVDATAHANSDVGSAVAGSAAHFSEPTTAEVPSAVAAASAGGRSASSASSTSPSVVVLALLLTVSGVLVLRVAASHRRLQQIRNASTPLTGSDHWTAIVDDVRAAFRIATPVEIRLSADVNVPAVAGLRQPTLLLPLDARDWPTDVRRMVALHELAHVARRDVLAQLIAQLACALYWFVPFVWQGARAAAALRERACDDLVLRAGVRPSAYADSLLTLADVAGGAELQVGALAMARPGSALRQRVVAILDPGARRDRVTRPAQLLVVSMAAASLTVISSVVLTAAPMELSDAAVINADWLLPPGMAPAPPATTPKHLTITSPTPVSPAPFVAPQTVSRLCSGDINRTSNSTTGAGGRRQWTLRVSGKDCRIDVDTDGTYEFNPEFTDIVRVADGGFVRIEVTTGGSRRELRLEPRGGTLTRTWRIDGTEQPWDDAARSWFASFLIELDRQTGIGAEVRLPLLLRQGGVDAVLAETAQIPSDHVRNEYYTRLASARKLNAAELTRLVDQATAMTKSDHYASSLLEAIAKSGLEGPARLAVARLIDTMDSDHYRATSIQALMGSGAVGTAEIDVLTKLVPKIDSDHYKAQVLTQLFTSGRLDAARTAALVRLASGVASDHYASEFLQRVARTELSTEAREAALEAAASIGGDHNLAEVLTALLSAPGTMATHVSGVLKAAQTIQSDHYHSEVLSRVLTVANIGERDLLAVVDAAKSIGSDHYQAIVLTGIARHRGATDAVREAVVAAAASGLSRHYQDQVRRAATR